MKLVLQLQCTDIVPGMRQALVLDPNDPVVHSNRSLCHLRLKNHAEARFSDPVPSCTSDIAQSEVSIAQQPPMHPRLMLSKYGSFRRSAKGAQRLSVLGAQAARDALAALRCDVLRAKSWARAGDALGALGCRQLARLSYEQVSGWQGSAWVVSCVARQEVQGVKQVSARSWGQPMCGILQRFAGICQAA